jgi:hypothetical protein
LAALAIALILSRLFQNLVLPGKGYALRSVENIGLPCPVAGLRNLAYLLPMMKKNKTRFIFRLVFETKDGHQGKKERNTAEMLDSGGESGDVELSEGEDQKRALIFRAAPPLAFRHDSPTFPRTLTSVTDGVAAMLYKPFYTERRCDVFNTQT